MPWLSTRLSIKLQSQSSTLEALLTQTTQLKVKVQQRLDYFEIQYDQPSKFVKAELLALELIITKAVFDLLQGPKKIVLGSHYQFAAKYRSSVHGIMVNKFLASHILLCVGLSTM